MCVMAGQKQSSTYTQWMVPPRLSAGKLVRGQRWLLQAIGTSSPVIHTAADTVVKKKEKKIILERHQCTCRAGFVRTSSAEQRSAFKSCLTAQMQVWIIQRQNTAWFCSAGQFSLQSEPSAGWKRAISEVLSQKLAARLRRFWKTEKDTGILFMGCLFLCGCSFIQQGTSLWLFGGQ